MRYLVEVSVRSRPGLLDPEGSAVRNALESLGFAGTSEVRVGKIIDLVVDAENGEAAAERVGQMCRKLLANPVTEDYHVEVRGKAPEPGGDGTGEERA
ncbi:MAG: phosphoribosylformylglycinamidine synthase subunit PurS [Gammaproteobacteria bacterium]|nr:phosphoribosylformylglycinamidine synthase subunit PurS [Gammaproteobacteria bacterium]MDE0246912.1 phosphoribosylformylglycinamidine synthase subunit PurS [Gammaproteobacteria bacterium]